MARVVASLAAVVLLVALGGCGEDDGAEPGASSEATLVLDFTPNAVHAGIYAAVERGYLADEGIGLEIREPSSSSDAPKLLEAGRADFAILDINDLGIARDRGLGIVGIAPIVAVPLASVIAARDAAKRPRQLEGRTVGVTGLPSDDAVLDAVVRADGGDPALVERTTIGFDAVAALAAGRVDAATAFWNAEGVALRERGVATREFRVGELGAAPYPELVLVTSSATLAERPDLVASVRAALARGHELAEVQPKAALGSLLSAVPALERSSTAAQLDALIRADAFSGLGDRVRFEAGVASWARFAARNGLPAPQGETELGDAFPPRP